MATSPNGADWKSAPQDYSAFFKLYHAYTISMLGKNGIDINNRQDVTSEIILRCFERGILESFDPDRVFEYKGQQVPARFKTFYGRYATLKARGERDKQNRIKNRESQICDLVMSEDDLGNPASWADLYGEPHEDHADAVIDALAEQQEAERVRELLAKIPLRSAHDRCDLVKIYDAVRAQIAETGEYDIKALQVMFGVGNTTMSNWVWRLKGHLAHIYGRPVPTKRPRRIGPKP